MHRCYVDAGCWDDAELILASEEEHHLVHVLRVKRGEKVIVFDGNGREAMASVCGKRGSKTSLELLEGPRLVDKPSVQIALAVALPKGNRMDLIIEKGTELGVSVIFPVLTERVVARPADIREKGKRARWQRVALTAARQCGVNWIPEIKPIISFNDFLGNHKLFDFFLVGSLGEDAVLLHSAVTEIRKKLEEARAETKCICLLIGPEGDLTPAELCSVVSVGATPVSLGSLVLRVETAALYGLAVLAYEFHRAG